MWWEKYIGQPYVPVDGDCMTLAEQVAENELDIILRVPEHETGLRAQARQIQKYRDEYAQKVETPEDCQPVLFLCRKRFFHIGVSARINNEDYVLHNDERHGSVILTRLRDMTRIGYEFEGFYRWI